MAMLNRWSVLIACGGILAISAPADEGMWTFDNPPAKLLQEKYHFTPTQAMAGPRAPLLRAPERRRIRIVRQPARPAADQSSRGARPAAKELHGRARLHQERLLRRPRRTEEMKSPDLEVNVLMSMENVTARVRGALEGRQERRKRNSPSARTSIADIERESLEKTGLRSDVVTLYQGGEYWLYRYKKYTDVRLVFAPEAADRVLRRRSRQLHLSALRPGHGAVPRLRKRQAHRHAQLSEVESQGRGRWRTGVRVRPSRLNRSAWIPWRSSNSSATPVAEHPEHVARTASTCCSNFRRTRHGAGAPGGRPDLQPAESRQGARRALQGPAG